MPVLNDVLTSARLPLKPAICITRCRLKYTNFLVKRNYSFESCDSSFPSPLPWGNVGIAYTSVTPLRFRIFF